MNPIREFLPRNDPKEHIDNCEKEWKIIGYHDKIIWPHLFPSTLDDFQNKWYKIEEAHGDTFTWKTLKQNFIKCFSFDPEEDQLKEAIEHIKGFVQNTSV